MRAPERWVVIRAALSEAGRLSLGALGGLARPPRLFRTVPDRLLFAPQDLRTGDPTVADAIYAGHFAFAGRAAQSRGASPFALPPPSDAWAEALYSFGWLRHLRAADTALARENARALVADAVGPRRRVVEHGVGRRPHVVARRLISFLAHSPLVLSTSDHGLYVAYLKAVGRYAAALERDMTARLVPAERLSAAVGLCFAGLCCGGFEGQLRRATRVLSAELDGQILPDGGHVGRNPATLVDLLLDLLPLRLLYASRTLETPPALERAIDRMLPMLRFFRHGSGDMALFNGMSRTPLDDLAAIGSVDRVMGVPVQHAVPSGYDRLEAGRTLVVMDTGAPPPLRSAAAAHAGCLSIELSSGLDRIVVNRGAPPSGAPGAKEARRTAAHSTLVVADVSSATFLDDARPSSWAASFLRRRLGPLLVAGPRRVTTERVSDERQGHLIDARHDGYEPAFGLIHARRLRLSADGSALDGIDVLKAGPARRGGSGPARHSLAARVRFHLHPAVVAVSDGRGELILELPCGERWTFAAVGGVPSLEDSVSYAVPEGRRAARQIVLPIALTEGADEVSVGWRFRKDPA